MPKITIKTIKPILVACIEGNGHIPDINKDINKLYEYIYRNNLQDLINGPTIGLFFTESAGKYIAAVPIKERIVAKGSIKIQTLPSIKCMSVLHEDRADSINESFNLLKKYQKKHKLQWLFPVREVYIPSSEVSGGYLTEIQVPIS